MASHVLDVLILVLFGIWGGLTAVAQIPSTKSAWIRKVDVFGAIPEWKFFAPTPGTSDYHLLYRDQYSDGSIGQWREVTFGEERRWWNVVWNPNRRQLKALFDIVLSLQYEWKQQPDAGIQASMAYLYVLNYVSNLPRTDKVLATQFLLMESYGCLSTRKISQLCVSALHGL